MSVETLSCSSCGAPLDIPVGAKYVTCSYCKARLEIKRTASVAYTETLEQISAAVDKISTNTNQMVGDLSYMRMRQELEHMDERWAELDAQYNTDGETINERILAAGKKDGSLKTGIWRILLGGLAVLLGLGSSGAGIVAFAGVVLIIFGIASLVTYSQDHPKFVALQNEGTQLTLDHQQEYDSYLDQRAELLEQIDSQSSFRAG